MALQIGFAGISPGTGNGARSTAQLVVDSGKIYAVDANGNMVTEAIILIPDIDGVMQYVV